MSDREIELGAKINYDIIVLGSRFKGQNALNLGNHVPRDCALVIWELMLEYWLLHLFSQNARFNFVLEINVMEMIPMTSAWSYVFFSFSAQVCLFLNLHNVTNMSSIWEKQRFCIDLKKRSSSPAHSLCIYMIGDVFYI